MAEGIRRHGEVEHEELKIGSRTQSVEACVNPHVRKITIAGVNGPTQHGHRAVGLGPGRGECHARSAIGGGASEQRLEARHIVLTSF